MTSYEPQLVSQHVNAVYVTQTNPAYQGNALIEALPPILDDAQLIESMTYLPEFNDAVRALPASERYHHLLNLNNCMIPLQRHLDFARVLEGMIRQGYVGRSPATHETARISQKLYEMQMTGVIPHQTATGTTPQLSASLIGLPGTGKTSTMKRACARFPQVIYHQSKHLYQITYLIIEAQTDKKSARGLCSAILDAMDKALPGANYRKTYDPRGKTSADDLLWSTAKMLNLHCVGVIVIEEIQNLENSNKGEQTVISELVSLCNIMHVPILFTGTNKANKTLARDFRQARRSHGLPIAAWDRLPEVAPPGRSEWRAFMEILFSRQVLRVRVALDELYLRQFREYTQTIPGIVVPLFVAAQTLAMAEGTETLSPDLITRTYNTYLVRLHPMLEALRDGNVKELARFADIEPIDLDEIWEDGTRSRSGTNHPGGEFIGASALANPAAKAAIQRLPASGDTSEEAGGKAATRSAPAGPRKKANSSAGAAKSLDLTGRPHDLRNAIVEAKRAGTTTIEELIRRNMAPALSDVLSSD